MIQSHLLRSRLRILLLCLVALPVSAWAQLFCVYDPLGASGDIYSMVQDYQLAAKRWGVNLDLKVYTDDNQVDAAFKAGQCDMASMIGMRARQYNKFTGTVDAPSVLENFDEVRDTMELLASPRLARFMVDDGYEVVGVVPIGPCYAMVNDRHINSLERAAGKRVATLEWDDTQPILAADFKAVAVPTRLEKIGELFNKGTVDVVIAPLVVYKALELNRGIGSKGGIVRRPLFELTTQVLTHADRFPADFGQKSREYLLAQTERAISLVRHEEADIDESLWIYVVHEEVSEWNSSMRSTLDHMTRAGHFDRHMLGMLKRVRCKDSPEEPECAATPEQRKNVGHP